MNSTIKLNKLSFCLVAGVFFLFISIKVHSGYKGYGIFDADAETVIQRADSNQKNSETVFSPDFFPILPWDPQHGFRKPFIKRRKWGLSSIAECNFNMAGFVRPEDPSLCEKYGLAAIMIPETGASRSREWKTLSDEEIEKRIRLMVEESGNSSAVFGYFIMDEPQASDFPALGKAVMAVKKYAPGKLAYINLYPDYASTGARGKSQLETESYTEYLEKYVQEVKPQIISYDNYMVQYSQDLEDSTKTASYFNNLMEIRRIALKYDIPFWNIVSSNQIRPFTTIPSPSNMSLQAYTTLAAGGRSVAWYTYYARGYGYAPIDSSKNKTLTWHYLQEVNRQIAILGPVMNHLASTGVYFTSPPPVASLPLLPGKLIQKAESDAPLMVGEFKSDDGSDYVMVVNLSLEKSAKFILNTTGSHDTMQIVSAVDGTLRPLDNVAGIWLVAGQGALIKLDSSGK